MASDLAAFDPLVADSDMAELLLPHPAELEVEIRRDDQWMVDEFVSLLKRKISEHLLENIGKELR